MPEPRQIKVSSLSAFTKEIEKLLESMQRACGNAVQPANWYRGHSRASAYPLKPGLYRHPGGLNFDELYDLEDRMLASFKRQAILHNFGGASNPDPMTQLFYMQHYGVPTRLLDWTINPYIALYFALSGAVPDKHGNYSDDAAVWVLDPYRWNEWAMQGLGWAVDRGPAEMDHKDVTSFHPKSSPAKKGDTPYPWPVAIVGAANTQRMFAQRGSFTVFGTDMRPMEEIHQDKGVPKDCLVMLRIPSTSIDPLLRTLISLGYTDSMAYPDLQGLAMEIRRLNGFRV